MHENDSDPQYDKEIEDCLKKLEKLSKIEYLHPEAKSAVAKELRKDYHNIDELHELINRINDWLKRYELWKKQEESPQEKEIKNDQEDIRFADFITWEKSSRDTIDLKRVYVDIAGDLVAGVLLSQIIYWWYIPGKDGKTKLRVKKNGKYYLVKNLDEWWNECRIKKDTAKRKLKHLENKGLIVIENHFFNGKKTNYITLNKSNFLKAIREYSEKSQRAIEENSIGAICTNTPSISAICTNRLGQSAPIITKTTSKTTEVTKNTNSCRAKRDFKFSTKKPFINRKPIKISSSLHNTLLNLELDRSMINTLCLYADSEEALSEKVELLLEQINNRGTNEFHNIGGWLYHAIIEDYQKDDFYTSGHKKAYGN